MRNEAMPLHLSNVAKVLRDAGYEPAKIGSQDGFTVSGDIGAVNVGYVGIDMTPANVGMTLRLYRASLAEFFGARVLGNTVIVTDKCVSPAQYADDEDLASELRSAYQHGGERTHEAWLAVAQRARELLSR